MRVITFRGWPVKRQRKIDENKILVRFYEHPPTTVTVAEWEEGRQEQLFPSGVKRSRVVRTQTQIGLQDANEAQQDQACPGLAQDKECDGALSAQAAPAGIS